MKRQSVYFYVIASCLLFGIFNYLEYLILKGPKDINIFMDPKMLFAYITMLFVIFLLIYALLGAKENGFGTPLDSRSMEENEIFEIMGRPVTICEEQIDTCYYYCFVKDRYGKIWAVKMDLNELDHVDKIFKIINGEPSPYPTN